MLEREAPSMEELPLKAQITRSAVHRITAHGEVDRLEVNTNLVRAPRFQLHVEKGVAPHRLDNVEPGHGLTGRRGVKRVAGAVTPIAAYGCLDAAALRAGLPANKGCVGALDLPQADHLLQTLVGRGRSGDDEQARRVAIKAVHDPGAIVVIPALRTMQEKAMNEGARTR